MRLKHYLAGAMLLSLVMGTGAAASGSLEAKIIKGKEDLGDLDVIQIKGNGDHFLALFPSETMTDVEIGYAPSKGKDSNTPDSVDVLEELDEVDTSEVIVIKTGETKNSNDDMLFVSWTDESGEEQSGFYGITPQGYLINGSGKKIGGGSNEGSDNDKEEPKNEAPAEKQTEAKKGSDGTGVTGSVVSKPVADLERLHKASLDHAYATSTINQGAKYHNNYSVDNSASVIMDNDASTSWQEGASGAGIGEGVAISLTETMGIEILSFKLGNWKSDRYHWGNNRPKTLTLKIRNCTTEVTFPDSWDEYYVKLSEPVEANEIQIRIEDVYYGNSWNDTCIAEIGVYGK